MMFKRWGWILTEKAKKWETNECNKTAIWVKHEWLHLYVYSWSSFAVYDCVTLKKRLKTTFAFKCLVLIGINNFTEEKFLLDKVKEFVYEFLMENILWSKDSNWGKNQFSSKQTEDLWLSTFWSNNRESLTWCIRIFICFFSKTTDFRNCKIFKMSLTRFD